MFRWIVVLVVRNQNAPVSGTGHTSVFFVTSLLSTRCPSAQGEHQSTRAQKQGDEIMLGIFAAVLIGLWLLGFFAFHITSAFVHIALVVGLILLALHFMRGRTATV